MIVEAKDMAWAIEQYECLVNRFTPIYGPMPHVRRIAFWDAVSRVPRETFVTVLHTFKSTWDKRTKNDEAVAPSPADLLKECKRIEDRKRVEKDRLEREARDNQSKPMASAEMDDILDEADIPGDDVGRRILRRARELMSEGKDAMKASYQAFQEISGR